MDMNVTQGKRANPQRMQATDNFRVLARFLRDSTRFMYFSMSMVTIHRFWYPGRLPEPSVVLTQEHTIEDLLVYDKEEEWKYRQSEPENGITVLTS
jgi:hypothetical protein